jgi:arsenate reductase (thioredoxin)
MHLARARGGSRRHQPAPPGHDVLPRRLGRLRPFPERGHRTRSGGPNPHEHGQPRRWRAPRRTTGSERSRMRPFQPMIASRLSRNLFIAITHSNSLGTSTVISILKHMSHGHIDVASAGSTRATEMHPMARAALGKLGISMDHQYPKSWDGFVRGEFNYIITVCDRSAERCPMFPGDPERIHRSCEDPAAARGTPEESHEHSIGLRRSW